MNPLLKRSALIVFLVLLSDQVVKIWIKTHMYLGQEFRIADWFIIHFTENNGMAFGLELGGETGKIFLSVFRILASLAIGWYLLYLIRKKAHPGLITCFSFIFAGAIGNIIDSVFYGVIFSESNYNVAQIFPAEGGYARFLHGRVVDMFYFPLLSGMIPDWVPIWGGESFLFFRPVFNIADSSITMGALLFLIFQKKFIHRGEKEESAVLPDNPGEDLA